MSTKQVTLAEISETVRTKLREHPSVTALARELGFLPGTLHNIMTGRRVNPRPEVADKLCAHFGITLIAVTKDAA